MFPSDGTDQWIAISVADTDCWIALLAELQIPGLDADSSPADKMAAIARRTQTRPADELATALRKRGVAATRVNGLHQLLKDPVLIERGYWRTLEHSRMGRLQTGGLPWTLNGQSIGPRFAAPILGADTNEVLTSWLDLSPTDIRAPSARSACSTAN